MGCGSSTRFRRPDTSKSYRRLKSDKGDGDDASSTSSTSFNINSSSVDGGMMYADSGGHRVLEESLESSTPRVAIVGSTTAMVAGGALRMVEVEHHQDSSATASSVGGGSRALKEAKRAGREEQEAKRHEKGRLSHSLTTPLVQRELDVIARGQKWMAERKDVSGRFGPALPPISKGKKVVPEKAMAFTVAIAD